MKIKRQKKCRKRLNLFKNNFNFKKPYRVITDINFLIKALKFKIKIKDQLEKYLDSPVELVTTGCILKGIEAGGDYLKGCSLIASSFTKWECIHKNKPVNAIKCIKSLIGETNPKNLFVASQSFNLTKLYSNKKVPLLHITHNTIMIVKNELSESIKKTSSNTIHSDSTTFKRSSALTHGDKKALGIIDSDTSPKIKKKKRKNPNPLSIKKPKNAHKDHSKNKQNLNLSKKESINYLKAGKKRRKYKISSHIIEAIQQKKI